MASLKCFEDLEVWQKSREFAKEIYSISKGSRLSRDLILRDQIIRCAISINSNIAEGFERGGTGEFIQFLSIAKGSAGELRSQLYIVLDQGYIDENKFKGTSKNTFFRKRADRSFNFEAIVCDIG
jgi:four helix bundle protein